MDALGEIHRDLESLKSRRLFALGTYAAILGVFFVFLMLQPPGAHHAGEARDAMWAVSFGLLLVGALLGAAITIGYPLVSRPVMYAIAGVMAVVCVSALMMVMDTDAPAHGDLLAPGMRCFVYGTGVSAVAMLILGVTSGRVWRRFPDPAFVVAMGMTGVGLAALHLRCGGVDPLHLFGFHLTPLLVLFGLAHVAVRARNRLAEED